MYNFKGSYPEILLQYIADEHILDGSLFYVYKKKTSKHLELRSRVSDNYKWFKPESIYTPIYYGHECLGISQYFLPSWEILVPYLF